MSLPWSWDTDGVVKAVVVEHIEELGGTAIGPPDGEHRQEHVPHEQWYPQLEPRPRLHVQLATVDDNHVRSNVVETHHPIFPHPSSLF